MEVSNVETLALDYFGVVFELVRRTRRKRIYFNLMHEEQFNSATLLPDAYLA